jgi:tetraacyldisaccharide 4'-kinase
MFETQQLIDILSNQRRDLLAILLRFGLGLLTPFYRFAIWWRNRRFDRDSQLDPATLIKRVAAPVISIGNLTTGGTGKTPLVIWTARFFRGQNFRVAVISRGYGADANHPSETRNDEAMEMELRLPDVPHLQDPDRYRVATIAVEELDSQIILLDDGFQHRRLRRDLDIVLIDAINPFGYNRLLPRGLMREPLSSLQRADVVVLTRCNLVSNDAKTAILDRMGRHITNALLVQTGTSPIAWLQFDGRQFPLEHLRGRAVFGFCGIGNPHGFRQTLQRLQLEPKEFRVFADHHHYSRADLSKLAGSAQQAGASALVCTHKDLVKVGCNEIAGLPVYALLIEIEFLEGQREFEAKLLSVCQPSRG